MASTLSTLLFVAAIATIGALMLRHGRTAAPAAAWQAPVTPGEGAVDILKERYARGEIGFEEFNRRLGHLLNPSRE
ncbi:SHOCT domain-containing protein [Nocardiopsis tropica]|uniref:SHOCT domain-containing protein n=1 Tax=Nocardiopsis tropica TaxID=109330 RepID=A0ABU7KLW3_9ACTN|nr:SHOCT domain-containing protein [Nocardiopsis umidischolae]MEE2049677.1 SHOCT domain-containing protein [Nocardiopsis umidischolae]